MLTCAVNNIGKCENDTDADNKTVPCNGKMKAADIYFECYSVNLKFGYSKPGKRDFGNEIALAHFNLPPFR
jgi:hypothetical protein